MLFNWLPELCHLWIVIFIDTDCSHIILVVILLHDGHVLRKEDDDWVKKYIEYEVEGPRPRGRPKKTWKEVVREDCQARKLNKVDAIDRCKWRKMIKDVR